MYSNEALSDPFDRKITIQKDFLNLAALKNTIVDAHYYERDRLGRHIVFMARALNQYNPQDYFRGIGIDDSLAVCIDESNKACVYNANGLKALFLTVYDINARPERLEKSIPLTWNNNHTALIGYEVTGTTLGRNCFDLNEWKLLGAGTSNFYYVINGNVSIDSFSK